MSIGAHSDPITVERLLSPADAALHRAAVALNSSLDLRTVLHTLTEVTLDATDADRASLLLAQDDGSYVPAVSLGPQSERELWEAFREMGPVVLDDVQQALLAGGRPVALPDAAASPVFPTAWAERFDLQSLVVVQLLASGEPCGLLVVDYPRRDEFDDGELSLLEAIAALAGVAVANARLHEQTERRARLRGILAAAAAQFAPPLHRREIARRLATTMSELLEVEVVGIGLIDADGLIQPLHLTGCEELPAPRRLAQVPARITDRVARVWERGVTRACELEADPWLLELMADADVQVERFVLLPLLSRGAATGAVLVGLPRDEPLDDVGREAAETLASLGGAALERRELTVRQDRQLRQLEVLDRLGAGLNERAGAEGLLSSLNELLADHDMEAVSIVFRDRRLRRHLGGAEPTDADRAVWRSSADVGDAHGEDRIGVPMRVGGRLVGTLWTAPAEVDSEQRTFLSVLASATGEVAARSALRDQIARVERTRALASERERIAEELRGSVGRILEEAHRQAQVLATQLGGAPALQAEATELARICDGGSFQLEQAVRALDHVPSGRRSLVGSLRGLGEAIEEASGISVLVDVKGQPMRLAAEIERALYRVAFEALTTVWRHARCELVRLELAFTPRELRLTVIDDGVGIKERHARPVTGEGLMAVRAYLAPVDGALEVEELDPHGMRLRARVPRRGPEPPAARRRQERRPYDLTARELQVVRLVADGAGNADIAQVLGISRHTVASHVSSVLHKLDVRDRRAAATKLADERLLDAEDASSSG